MTENWSVLKMIDLRWFKAFQVVRIEHLIVKRELQKTRCDSVSGLFFDLNRRIHLSKTVIFSHMKSNFSTQTQQNFTLIVPPESTGYSLRFCDQVWGSTADLRKHLRDRVINVNTKDGSFSCHIYSKACKGEDVHAVSQTFPQEWKIEAMAFFCKEVTVIIYIYIYRERERERERENQMIFILKKH